MNTRNLNLPDRIPIGGMIYTLEYRKRLFNDKGEPAQGACLLEEKKIQLLTRYPTHEAALGAFRHEYNHAIVLEYVIEISHDDLERMSQGQNQVQLAIDAALLK